MIPSEASDVLSLYSQIAPGSLFRRLQRDAGVIVHDGIYTPRVLIWMMIAERLDRNGTVARSVGWLAQGRFDQLLSCCKRARTKRISIRTGGYCQARQHLPTELVERSMDELLKQLRERLQPKVSLGQPRVYVLDGSSLELQDTRLTASYPPAQNQYGPSHWPMLRIVAMHDLATGLAERPYWGPQNGEHAVSEQDLAERAMNGLPPKSVIIGDRNFGIFRIAYAVHVRGHQTIIRLTKKRAHSLVGPIARPREYAIDWRPSQWERRKRRELPEDAAIGGRLIAWRVGRGKHKEWLYLFTTLPNASEEVVELYGQRWTIETDLRTLKQTLRLHRIAVRSVDMIDKELMIAVIGYNLVRAIMCLAASWARVPARRLSFAQANNIVQAGLAGILAAATPAAQMRALQRTITLVAQCKLPVRAKRRAYPRAVWKAHRYAARKPHKN